MQALLWADIRVGPNLDRPSYSSSVTKLNKPLPKSLLNMGIPWTNELTINARTWISRLVLLRKLVVVEDWINVRTAGLLKILISSGLYPCKEEELNCQEGSVVDAIVELSGIKPAYTIMAIMVTDQSIFS